MARRTKTAMAAAPAAAVVLPPLGKQLDGPGEPLRIVADLGGPVAMPYGPIALDSMLAWAEAKLVYPTIVDGLRDIEISVAREPGGRFHLASFSVSEPEAHDSTFVNQRFPVAESMWLAPRMKRVQVNAGAQKSYRIPLHLTFMRDDRMEWYAIGDRERISYLLQLVTHLGKRRGVGKGLVLRWAVEPCAPWPGFPVVRDGLPLRPLPLDWPGLSGGERRYCRLTYPYWRRPDEVLCSVPCYN